MKRLLPVIAMLMLAACACGGQCPKDNAHASKAYGQCEHCATGKGECVCAKGEKHAH